MNVKRITLTVFFVIGCLCAAGYSGDAPAGDSNAGNEVKEIKVSEDKTGYPVIGHLKKRDKVITIRKGPDGPLYTVEGKGGKTLAVNLPAEKLVAEFPDLKNVIENGMAVDDAAYRPDKADLKSIDIRKR